MKAKQLIRSGFAILLSLFGTPIVANADELVGPVLIINAGTLRISGEEVRLMGVDAPELEQICWNAEGEPWQCGEQAAMALKAMTKDAAAKCRGTRRDHRGRLLAVCAIDGLSINAWLVSQGWALAYRSQSLAFVALEDAARGKAKGIWAGAFEPPSVWRAKRQAIPTP